MGDVMNPEDPNDPLQTVEIPYGDDALSINSITSVSPKYGIGNKVDPITLSWKDVEVWTSNPDKVRPEGVEMKNCFGCKSKPPKQILRKISGVAKPGELVALMGASGAGKTTLLNFLAFRTQSGLHVRGSRFVNGFPGSSEDLGSVSAYIEQEDIFFGALTVREHLEFHANLRIGKEVSKAEKNEMVNDIMQTFNLSKSADVQIGFPGRIAGISGGEMKRLALASELLWNPQFLICDEPTTGLDVYMATSIVKQLKELTKQNRTIICTIHQPSATIFSLFDRVILLADGRVAYEGPIPKCVEFFEAQGYVCPQNYNMAEHLVHTVAISPTRSPGSMEKVHGICDEYLKSSAYTQLQDMFAQHQTKKHPASASPLKIQNKYQVSWFTQFFAVLKRSFRCIISDPWILPVRLLQTIIIGLVIGVVFFQKGDLKNNTVDHIRFGALCGAIFLIVVNLSLQYIYCALDGFQSEIPLFLREHFNGMYRVDVYFFAKQMADLPLFIIFPIIFTLIVDLMIGFPWKDHTEAILILYLFTLLVAFCAGSYGYFISAAAPNLNAALIFAAGLVLPLMLYSGFIVRSKDLKAWKSWARYLSWFWYADEAMTTYRMEGLTLAECLGKHCTSEEHLKEYFEFTKDNIWYDLLGVLVIAFFFRTLAFLVLYRKTNRH